MSTFPERAEDYQEIAKVLESDGFWTRARGAKEPAWYQSLLSGMVFLLGGETVKDVVSSGRFEEALVHLEAQIFTENRLIRCSATVVSGEGTAREESTYAIGLGSVVRVDVVSKYHVEDSGNQYPTISEATLRFRDDESIKLVITGPTDVKERRTAVVEAIVKRLA